MSSLIWDGVAEVLKLVKEHSERYKPPRHAMTKVERFSGWATLIGGAIVVAGEVVRQVGDAKMSSLYLAYMSLSILGLVIFATGVVVSLVEFV